MGNLKEAAYVNGEGGLAANIAYVSARVEEAPIDVGVISIGENGHIAFIAPPADFETRKSYIIVNLDARCKAQQVCEGWFASMDDVPWQAIYMTVYRMLQSRCIVSLVPKAVKAIAIRNTLIMERTGIVPATILKSHSDRNLWLGGASAAGFRQL